MRSLILSLLALLIAAPAWGWSKLPAGTDSGCTVLRPYAAPSVCYYNFSDTTDSTILNVAACDHVTVKIDSDTTATTTGGEGYIRSCVSRTVSSNTCDPVYNDAGAVTMNGDPATGRAATYGIVANWIYFDVTANAGSDAGRVMVICH